MPPRASGKSEVASTTKGAHRTWERESLRRYLVRAVLLKDGNLCPRCNLLTRMQTLPSDSRPGVDLAPFRGIRYARDRVSGIANVTSPPYDVISGGNLMRLRAAEPHNVVRLILPGEGPDAPRAAAELLADWLSSGILIRDPAPSLYLYEQFGQTGPADPARSWRQRGIIGLVRLGDPDEAGILPHEGVFPPVVADRRRLMEATRANLEPIFLFYDGASPSTAGQTATDIMRSVAQNQPPLLSIQTEDNITHRLWGLSDQADLAAITADLAARRAMIADGHHRYAAYLELRDEMTAAGHGPCPWEYGLAYLVDSAESPPQLGAIHRVLPDLPMYRAAKLAKAAFNVDDLPPGTDLPGAMARMADAGREGTAFLLASQGGFTLLTQADQGQVAAAMPPDASAAWQRLDAAILQQLLLARLWGIPDSDPAVQISHDAPEAVAATADGGVAVLVNPVSFDAVRAIAEHGERVPRKSTSFGPKPRTGLILRAVDTSREPVARRAARGLSRSVDAAARG